MYIAVVKDDKKETVYRAGSKSLVGLTRIFSALDSASCINGVVFEGTAIDDPKFFALKVIKKGKVKKATLVDWANVEDTFRSIVQYAKTHGASDLT